MPLALMLQLVNYFFNRFLACKSVKLAGINHFSRRNVRKYLLVYVNIAVNNLYNRKVEFLRKFPVTLIVRRNSHDCAGSV